MNPDVSIVVPIYQVEPYIKNCMISICNQTYKNFEVILVNDGTKDKSMEIAENVLSENNISYRVLEQENKGLAAARNVGIRVSTGKWVVCVDSDDVISKAFLETLFKGSYNKKVDLSIVSYRSVTVNGLFDENRKKCKTHRIVDKNNILFKFLNRKLKIIVPAMLIKRQFIEEKQLFFNESIKFSEDQEFIWRVLFEMEACSYNGSKLYNYLLRENSKMRASSVEKIMTGYQGFKEMTEKWSRDYDKQLGEKIMHRWVFGALHSSSKMMMFDDFEKLAKEMNYRDYLFKLCIFNDYRVRIMSLVLGVSLRTFYQVCRHI